MIPSDRLQELIMSKESDRALEWCKKFNYNENWAIIDGALVIYNGDSPPVWLKPILEMRDDNGNTPPDLMSVDPRRAPRPGEFRDPQPVSVTYYVDG